MPSTSSSPRPRCRAIDHTYTYPLSDLGVDHKMAHLHPAHGVATSRIPRPKSSVTLRQQPTLAQKSTSRGATGQRSGSRTVTVPPVLTVTRTGLETGISTTSRSTIAQKSSYKQLRPARSYAPLPSNYIPVSMARPAIAVAAAAASAGYVKPIRRVSSTHFKENFFSPMPPVPGKVAHPGVLPTSLPRKRSQVLAPPRSVLISTSALPGRMDRREGDGTQTASHPDAVPAADLVNGLGAFITNHLIRESSR